MKSLAQLRDERAQARRRKLASQPRKVFRQGDRIEFQRVVDAPWEPGEYLELNSPGAMRAHVPTRRLRHVPAAPVAWKR